MKKKSIDEIIKQYETSGKLMYEATLSGDYKTNNKEGAKLLKIYKLFEEDLELAKECIPILLNNENVVLQTEAAAYCLALRINTKCAEKKLEEIGNDSNNGIFGFNAKMTLQVWKEKGELTIYQHKK